MPKGWAEVMVEIFIWIHTEFPTTLFSLVFKPIERNGMRTGFDKNLSFQTFEPFSLLYS